MRKHYLSLLSSVLLSCAAWAQGPNDSGTYYQAADGQKGRALKTALFNIITHHTNVGYDGLWDVYAKSDVRPDGTYWDMYSCTTKYTSGDRGSSYKKEGDMVNREHTVPQSWFSKANPMKSDAFHVVPTDGYVNGKRGNLFYGEVKNATYSSNQGFSKVGPCATEGYTGTVFEPDDEYKGDLARGYFYMATAYEDKAGSWDGVFGEGTYPSIVKWQLDMLLRWAAEDPVSQKEIDRNNAICEFQKNRNPFIDYPGLEQYIWGTMMEEAFSYDNYNREPNPDPEPDPDPENPDDKTELVGSGTEADPYNVASVVSLIEAMEADVYSDEIYVRGIITSIKEVNTKYGNATYYISDDGTDNNTLYVYRSKWLNGADFTDENAIHVGDTVVIKGLYVNYKGDLPETVVNQSHIASIKYEQEKEEGGNGDAEDGDDDKEDGGDDKEESDSSVENPYSVAAALQIITAMEPDVYSKEMYVRGIIASIQEVSTKYGNATYYISDDGTDGNTLYIYRSKWLNGESFTDENAIHVGDTVIIKGLFVNYQDGLPESVAEQSHIVSIDITDGIKAPNGAVQATKIYDITGKSLKNITLPGVYIVNGRKVIVR